MTIPDYDPFNDKDAIAEAENLALETFEPPPDRPSNVIQFPTRKPS